MSLFAPLALSLPSALSAAACFNKRLAAARSLDSTSEKTHCFPRWMHVAQRPETGSTSPHRPLDLRHGSHDMARRAATSLVSLSVAAALSPPMPLSFLLSLVADDEEVAETDPGESDLEEGQMPSVLAFARIACSFDEGGGG